MAVTDQPNPKTAAPAKVKPAAAARRAPGLVLRNKLLPTPRPKA